MAGPLSRFDQSTRRILVLGLATILAVVAASIVVGRETARVRPVIEPHAMFPDLDVNDATSLVIRSSTAGVLIVKDEDGDWVVPIRGGYPARPGPILQTIGGLAELELLEAKTTREDWHHFLNLLAPVSEGEGEDEGGNEGEGVEITLSNASGETLASIIVGNQPEGNVLEPDGRARVHVRHSDESQTWLARGFLSLQTDITEWLATQLYDIAPDRIREARISLANGENYTVSRATRESPNFELLDLPVGREVLSPYVINAVGTALSGMEVEDVLREVEVDLSGGSEIVYRTFDGLELTLRLASPNGPNPGWATIFARFTGLPDVEASDAAAVAEEAANVNVLTDGWAFRLPDYKARQMSLGLAELLRPNPGIAPPEGSN